MKITKKQLQEIVNNQTTNLLQEGAESYFDLATYLEAALENYLNGGSATEALYSLKGEE